MKEKKKKWLLQSRKGDYTLCLENEQGRKEQEMRLGRDELGDTGPGGHQMNFCFLKEGNRVWGWEDGVIRYLLEPSELNTTLLWDSFSHSSKIQDRDVRKANPSEQPLAEVSFAGLSALLRSSRLPLHS